MPEPLRQRQPRVRSSTYMGKIAQLPCVACYAEGRGLRRGVHVAHLRHQSPAHGKRECGKAEKPSDDPWTLPLCPRHHMQGNQSQHAVGEEVFFTRIRVNPFDLCLALSACLKANGDAIAVIVAHAGPERHGWAEDIFV